jgi:hypothetical protein
MPNLLTRGIRGFVEGILVDTGTWMLTAYIPSLANPSGLRIPGYDPRGIHWDDLLSQLAAFGVVLYSAVKWDARVAVEGLGMSLGAFFISRHQACPAAKLWEKRV